MSLLLDDDPFANLSRPTLVARPRSSGHGSAHTRPAFATRPSLPSLHTLAQLNVSMTDKKVRKGTPGARLPHEPWDMDLAAEFHLFARNTTSPPLHADETRDDADTDSLPSEPSSSALSRSSSLPPPSILNSPMTDSLSTSIHEPEEEDPLSYHSDFDYYTQSFSDHSDSDSDLDTTATDPTVGVTSLYDPSHTMRRVSAPRPKADSPPPRDSPPRWRGQPHVPDLGQRDDRRNPAPTDPDKPHRRRPSDYSSSSSSSSPSDDDADSITVYYSLDGMSNGAVSRSHSRTRSRHSKAAGGSDDDVPLAQRVPTALSAQKSIRKQLHDERQQRKLERARTSRKPVEPPVPPRALEPPSPAPPARSRKRSMSAAPAPASRTPHFEAFPVEDLTRKLMSLQATSNTVPPTAPLPYDNALPTNVPPRRLGYSTGVSRSSSRGRHPDYTTYLQQKVPKVPEIPSQDKPLSSTRPFHRPEGRHPDTQSPTDQTTAPRLGRSTTAAPSRTTRTGRDTPSCEQHAKSRRVSEDSRKPSASLPRPPADRENDVARHRPPVPPLPISDSTPPQPTSRVPVVQQRIFIGDMQRFNMVEIAPTTNARDVIDTVAKQGMLDKSGSWMVFEMAQDYGMERPVRDYELLADVSASWNKDKLLNAFVIKQTPLAQSLGRSAIPTSAPIHRGWVEWESKRGKWSKRWMELREHGLWLSKRDTGKDEVFLCSLSNFDAYFVTRKHKAPKAFVFAIKSTDHLSLFENAADYLHVFSCNPKEGDNWMQAILIARSYVLYQERHVLFTKSGEMLSQAKPLARSRTRKQSVSRPAQPLVNVPPPFSQAPAANVAFEPGSLLAKRKEVGQL